MYFALTRLLGTHGETQIRTSFYSPECLSVAGCLNELLSTEQNLVVRMVD